MGPRKYDFGKLFNPRSIAIVGVPREGYRLGGNSFLKKLQESGFRGKLYPINPKASEIRGLKAYPDLSTLPETPDLAIVSVAARLVPSILEECARIGLRHIHILSSGFKETGTGEGIRLEKEIRSISREKGLLVIGPNCMGPYCPSSGLTAWGAIPGLDGPLGIISQSGGITQRLTEYTCSLGIGVSKAVSFGNGTVLDSCDYLEYMAEEKEIRGIAMYLESVHDGRRFLRLAREVGKEKPIVIWKGGESEAGAATAASHTGAMSGEERVWEGFFRQTGAIRVRSMEEWVDAVMTMTLLTLPGGKGVFLIGGGGGNSVAYSDVCIREGLDVPRLSDDTMVELRKRVPIAGSIAGNPLDMFRTFQDSAYLAGILELGYEDPNVSMIIVDRLIPRTAFHLPDLPDSTPEIIRYLKDRHDKKPTVFTVESGGGDPDLAAHGAVMRRQFCESGIPAFPSLKRAARALAHLSQWSQMTNDNRRMTNDD
jgi:acyl-CoA synthetase (NDP forming)